MVSLWLGHSVVMWFANLAFHEMYSLSLLLSASVAAEEIQIFLV
jgi:hypothetical protein